MLTDSVSPLCHQASRTAESIYRTNCVERTSVYLKLTNHNTSCSD